ncbi:hypothetical protein [Giesbergeria anulus]|uniref:UDP-N-acetylglucosamine kinase n=1 Tax=Giesbergeria anulus TaxID=180197 RepID=A0A1H9SNJ3_9BURK|nr:hypothetical protein [Giesbergeria anulus]SER85879.1 hypothetical protein SAMN02982919_03165 [Giesbergeria anulus]
MTTVQPRLRMFAGPNGSGKSTLKEILKPEWLGVYINADDLEAEIRANGFVSLHDFGVEATQAQLRDFFANSTFLIKEGLTEDAQKIYFKSFLNQISISTGMAAIFQRRNELD